MQMTFDEYDAMIEKFESLKTPVCWPTPEQILMFEKDPDKWLKFCCYLYEFAPNARTDEEKESKHNMMTYINRHLELVDEEDLIKEEELDDNNINDDVEDNK